MRKCTSHGAGDVSAAPSSAPVTRDERVPAKMTPPASTELVAA